MQTKEIEPNEAVYQPRVLKETEKGRFGIARVTAEPAGAGESRGMVAQAGFVVKSVIIR